MSEHDRRTDAPGNASSDELERRESASHDDDADEGPSRPWYAEGVRFECLWPKCVACCTGEPGYVWVSPEEVAGLAAQLSLTSDDFLHKYARLVEGSYSLLELANGDCVFLREQGCAVYRERPAQCRTYPFWPEVLQSRESWEAEGNHCPGINHGERVYTRAEIEASLAHAPKGRPRWFSEKDERDIREALLTKVAANLKEARGTGDEATDDPAS